MQRFPVDLDECEETEVNCSDYCENTLGSYRCACPLGYELSVSDPTSCQDVNECLDDPCSHECSNEAGSYRCLCPEGLTSVNDTCTDLELELNLNLDLDLDKNQCSHNSTQVDGEIKCVCPPGFELDNDGKTCKGKCFFMKISPQRRCRCFKV